MNSKFKIGDKVLVHGKLQTKIEKVESTVFGIIYWFRDEKNKLWYLEEDTDFNEIILDNDTQR